MQGVDRRKQTPCVSCSRSVYPKADQLEAGFENSDIPVLGKRIAHIPSGETMKLHTHLYIKMINTTYNDGHVTPLSKHPEPKHPLHSI